MLKLKKITGQLLMVACIVFLSNAPAYAQTSCTNGEDCNNSCGDDCPSPTYGSADCITGLACCYNPNEPQHGSYWSDNACKTLLAPNAYNAGNCGYCTCCYNPNNHQDTCYDWD